MKITRNRGLPPIANIESFIKVVELGSVSAAADELALTQSAVSRHVIDLERFLNKTLFTRGTSGLGVTTDARTLAAKLSMLLGDMNSVLYGVESGISGRTVRISAPPIFCIHLLGKHCHHIQTLFEANIEITSRIGTPDLLTDGIDIALVNTPIPPPDYTAELLLATEYFPYISVELLGSRSADDLRLFQTEALIDQLSLKDAWSVFFREKALGRPPALRTTFSIIDASLSAVLYGQGIAFLPEFAAEDYVRDGRMIRLGATSYASARSRYYLLMANSFADDVRAKRFSEWVRTALPSLDKDHRKRLSEAGSCLYHPAAG